MTKEIRLPVFVRRSIPKHLFTTEEVALRCRVHVSYVEKLYRLGIISCHPNYERYFAPQVTIRVQKVLRLRNDLGVNEQGAAVILDLLERIDDLERKLGL